MPRLPAALRRTILGGGRAEVANALAQVDSLDVLSQLYKVAVKWPGANRKRVLGMIDTRRDEIVDACLEKP